MSTKIHSTKGLRQLVDHANKVFGVKFKLSKAGWKVSLPISQLFEMLLSGELREVQDLSQKIQEFSPRELAIFKKFGKGQHRSGIAKDLGISEKTIYIFLYLIRNKLGLKSTMEVTQLARRLSGTLDGLLSNEEEKLLKLSTHRVSTTQTLAKKAGLPMPHARRCLSSLEEAGKILSVGKDRWKLAS